MNYNITFSGSFGSDTNNFSFYDNGNGDNFTTPRLQTLVGNTIINKSYLSGGTYTITNIDSGATLIRLVSIDGVCSGNYNEYNIPGVTTTTTTIPTTTTTTTSGGGTTTTTTAAPTTTTTTAAPTTTTTTTAIPEVYFTNDTLSINNIGSKTYSVTFSYEINASCDNAFTNNDPNQATTTFEISTNSGVGFTTIDTVIASIPGGAPQSDSQQKTGTVTLTGITNPTSIVVGGTIECAYSGDGRSGSVKVTISSVTVDSGTATIICDDIWYYDCSGTYSMCTSSPTTTTTTAAPTTTTTTTAAPEYWYTAQEFVCSGCTEIGGVVNITDSRSDLNANNFYADSIAGNTWKIITTGAASGGQVTNLVGLGVGTCAEILCI